MAEDQVVGTEGGAEPAPPPPPMNERPVDGPGSGRSELRKQLEGGFEKARKAEEEPQRGRPAKPKQVSRARSEMGAESPEPAPAEEAAPEGEQEEAAQPQTKAPDGWSKEAKAEWEALSPTIQAAVAKREADMSKGVEEIKKKYAELDGVLGPRMDVIRRHGHTPAAAVNQLFSWFEALSSNPLVAFPALANSFKFDLRTLPGIMPLQQQQMPQQQVPGQQPGQQQEQPVGDMPPAMQKYIYELQQRLQGLEQGFSQQIGQLSNSFQAQSQAKTEEILANWSKDKPYFEDVRRMMAHLISSQAVPPLQNGAADLDKAYDMALWALPDVRQRILEEQQKAAEDARTAKEAAEKKAQQTQAEKARKAQAGSLTASAPGNLALKPGKSKGKSVRESIMEAREELSES